MKERGAELGQGDIIILHGPALNPCNSVFSQLSFVGQTFFFFMIHTLYLSQVY